jgi:general secretion pathway protein D
VAVQTEVVPLINDRNQVQLDIVQQVDEEAGNTVIDGNSNPSISSQVLQTSVTVPNNGTVVLGGVIKETKNTSNSGIPYLSKIPVLGVFFKNNSKSKTRDELVIVLHPEVTRSPDEAVKSGEREMEYYNLEPDLASSVYPINARKKDPTPAYLRRPTVNLKHDDSVPALEQK